MIDRPAADADALTQHIPAPRAGDVPAQARNAGVGFDTEFLPFRVDTPTATPAVEADLNRLADGETALQYTHFELTMSRSRRLARWVAWNIDGRTLAADISREGQRFRPDPRLPASAQVLDEVYIRNRLDRGHLARRADLLWGSRAEAERANADSFFFTNITPQMDDFNQAALHGVWGRLENALLATVDRNRASVFAGPVLGGADPAYRGVRVPREFWKVLIYRRAGQPRARIFLVTQSPVLEALPDPLTEFQTYAISAADLTARTGLRLSDDLTSRVRYEPQPSVDARERAPITSVAAIDW